MFSHAPRFFFVLASASLSLVGSSPAWIGSLGPASSAGAPQETAAPKPLDLHGAKITFGAMGTEVIIQGYHADAEHLDLAIAAARAEIDRVEDMMTSWRDSPLVRMNDGADGTPHEVPKELSDLVQR